MKINVDLDGCVADFCRGFIQMLQEYDADRYNWIPYPDQWNWWPQWNMSQGEWMAWFRKGVESGKIWRDAPMIEDARRVLWELSDAEHHIRIVTHRLAWPGLHATAIKTTVDWLELHNVPYRDIAFESSKTEIDADVIVDDKPDLSWAQKGKINLLFDQPYNRGIITETAPAEFTRVFGWRNILEIVRNAE